MGKEKKAAKEDAPADDAPPDAPGRYKIIAPSAVAVSSTVTLGGERVGVLEPGNTFTISSIKEASDRIRGRIEEPNGWISLMNTETGVRYAKRIDVDDKTAAKDGDAKKAAASEKAASEEKASVAEADASDAASDAASEKKEAAGKKDEDSDDSSPGTPEEEDEKPPPAPAKTSKADK